MVYFFKTLLKYKYADIENDCQKLFLISDEKAEAKVEKRI